MEGPDVIRLFDLKTVSLYVRLLFNPRQFLFYSSFWGHLLSSLFNNSPLASEWVRRGASRPSKLTPVLAVTVVVVTIHVTLSKYPHPYHVSILVYTSTLVIISTTAMLPRSHYLHLCNSGEAKQFQLVHSRDTLSCVITWPVQNSST